MHDVPDTASRRETAPSATNSGGVQRPPPHGASTHGALPIVALLGLALLAAIVAGCAANTEPPEHMADGRVLEAAEGRLTGTFDMPNPRKGENDLMIQVFDADEMPVGDARVEVRPWMPAHGHGSVDVAAQAVEGGAGGYLAPGVYFQMTGYWELTVEVHVGDEMLDSFLVPLHVR